MGCRVLLCLVTGWLLFGSAVSEQPVLPRQPADAIVPSDPHGTWGWMRVEHIAISRDGTRLAAAYFEPELNRAGIRWRAFVAQWDLRTGQRTIIPNAMRPIVFSPDGNRLVMGNVGRQRLRQRWYPKTVEPALWRFGDPEPIGVIEDIEEITREQMDQPVEYEVHWDRQGEIELFVRITGKERAPAWRFDAMADLTDAEAALLPAGLYVCAGRNQDLQLLAVADRRAVIEVWDTRAAKLRHTLRLHDKPTNTVLVAAVQASSVFGDAQRNQLNLASHVRLAAASGARIIVLPEAAVTGYLSPDLKTTWQVDNRPTSEGLSGADPSGAAETVPGPSIEYFARLAKQFGVYLTVPLLEVDRKTGRYYNTVVLLGPRGEQLIHYRKRNPWPWAERSWVTEGNLGNPVLDTRYGRLGMAICYDIHQQAEVLAHEKIDLLLYSIAWVEDADSPWFDQRLPAIASQHNFHIIASNWTVPAEYRNSGWHGFGQSRVIDRTGQIIAKAGHDEAVVYAELPIGFVDERNEKYLR
jgi:predicted amidohydrolase